MRFVQAYQKNKVYASPSAHFLGLSRFVVLVALNKHALRSVQIEIEV